MSAKKQAEPRLVCDCWEEWSWEASSSWLVEGVRWRVGRGSLGVVVDVDSVMAGSVDRCCFLWFMDEV